MMGVIVLKKIFKLFQNVSCSTEIYDADNRTTLIIYPIFNRQGYFRCEIFGMDSLSGKLLGLWMSPCKNPFSRASNVLLWLFIQTKTVTAHFGLKPLGWTPWTQNCKGHGSHPVKTLFQGLQRRCSNYLSKLRPSRLNLVWSPWDGLPEHKNTSVMNVTL